MIIRRKRISFSRHGNRLNQRRLQSVSIDAPIDEESTQAISANVRRNLFIPPGEPTGNFRSKQRETSTDLSARFQCNYPKFKTWCTQFSSQTIHVQATQHCKAKFHQIQAHFFQNIAKNMHKNGWNYHVELHSESIKDVKFCSIATA